jgi:hypothetical protein
MTEPVDVQPIRPFTREQPLEAWRANPRPNASACPICFVEDGYIRTRDAVWGVCQTHKLRWRENYWCRSWSPDDPEPAPCQRDWSKERVWDSRDKMLGEYQRCCAGKESGR